MVVKDLSSWVANAVSKRKWTFEGSGKPFQASWRSQGLSLSARTIEGVASQPEGSKAMELESATIGGPLDARVAQTKAQGGNTATIKASRAKIVRSGDLDLTLEGPIQMTNATPDGSVVTMTGSSATMKVDGQKRELKNAVLTGGVRLTLKGQARQNDGSVRSVTGDVTAQSIHFDNASHTIRLDGGVVAEGSDTFTYGKVTAGSATITLSESGAFRRIEFASGPVQSTVRDLGGRSKE